MVELITGIVTELRHTDGSHPLAPAQSPLPKRLVNCAADITGKVIIR